MALGPISLGGSTVLFNGRASGMVSTLAGKSASNSAMPDTQFKVMRPNQTRGCYANFTNMKHWRRQIATELRHCCNPFCVGLGFVSPSRDGERSGLAVLWSRNSKFKNKSEEKVSFGGCRTEARAAACLLKIVTEKTFVLPPDPSGNGDGAQYRLTVMTPKRRYFSYLRERWWVVMLCIALAVSGVVTYETVWPETYNSFAQLYLTEGPQMADNLFGEVKDDYATQIELLKGNRLQGAALNDLGTEAGQLKNPIKIDVVRPMETSILQLRATGPDPALTQRFLQALINEYLAFKRETRLSTSEDVVNSLTDELSGSEKNLQAEQDKWTAFQRTNNVALLEEESRSAGMSLADQNVQLADLNLQRELL